MSAQLHQHKSKTDWSRVSRETVTDEPVNFDSESDVYNPNDSVAVQQYWEKASISSPGGRGVGSKPKKILLSVRYSADVVAYFRATGKGWQARMDAALREWMAAHRAA